ncbi:hypothetical protein ADUPG1_006037 [Aduncisulcus paluster]|uniref:Uncharacterized protein n=1 Tax=Aduncisulcus paluster TaxID=2918883 RepID=A0ABQ5KGM3_9EUKA|nr:hypothetical protein ADUPG1_006037 [Aduncisulcus paluster]
MDITDLFHNMGKDIPVLDNSQEEPEKKTEKEILEEENLKIFFDSVGKTSKALSTLNLELKKYRNAISGESIVFSCKQRLLFQKEFETFSSMFKLALKQVNKTLDSLESTIQKLTKKNASQILTHKHLLLVSLLTKAKYITKQYEILERSWHSHAVVPPHLVCAGSGGIVTSIDDLTHGTFFSLPLTGKWQLSEEESLQKREWREQREMLQRLMSPSTRKTSSEEDSHGYDQSLGDESPDHAVDPSIDDMVAPLSPMSKSERRHRQEMMVTTTLDAELVDAASAMRIEKAARELSTLSTLFAQKIEQQTAQIDRVYGFAVQAEDHIETAKKIIKKTRRKLSSNTIFNCAMLVAGSLGLLYLDWLNK